MMPSIRVDDEVMEALSKKIVRPFKDTPNDVLRRLLGLEQAGDDEVRASRPSRGDFLPMALYRRAILQVLASRDDGKANVPTVMGNVSKILRKLLTPDDQKHLKSGMVRWENRVLWERFNMVREGLLRKDSPRGEWEITQKGREYLERGGKTDEAAEWRRQRMQRIHDEAVRKKMAEQEGEPSEDY